LTGRPDREGGAEIFAHTKPALRGRASSDVGRNESKNDKKKRVERSWPDEEIIWDLKEKRKDRNSQPMGGGGLKRAGGVLTRILHE